MFRGTRSRVALGLTVPAVVAMVALAPVRAEALDARQILAVAQQASIGAGGGQCKVFANTVVASASKGRIALSKYHQGFADAGAVAVPLELAGPGDIIQVTPAGSTDASAEAMRRRGGPLHTAIVEENLGGMRFRVIDSNWSGNERIGRHLWEPVAWANAKGGGIIKAWRFGSGGTVAAGTLGDGSFVQVAGTQGIYRIAGAAPLPILSWNSVGGEAAIATIDYSTLNNLAPFPVDGTVLQAGPGGPLYRVSAGVPRPLPAGATTDRPPVVIDPAAIANAGGPGAFARLRNAAYVNRGVITRMRLISGRQRVARGARTVLTYGVTAADRSRPVGRCLLERRQGRSWVGVGAANLDARGRCVLRARISAPSTVRARFVASTGWRSSTAPGLRIRLR